MNKLYEQFDLGDEEDINALNDLTFNQPKLLRNRKTIDHSTKTFKKSGE